MRQMYKKFTKNKQFGNINLTLKNHEYCVEGKFCH